MSSTVGNPLTGRSVESFGISEGNITRKRKKKKKILNEGEREKVEKAIKSDRERETSGLSHDVYPVVNFCNISS